MNAANPGFTVMAGSATHFKAIIQINLIKPVEIGFNCLPDKNKHEVLACK